MSSDSSPKQDKSFLLSLLGQPNTASVGKSSYTTKSLTESPLLSKSRITRSIHDAEYLADRPKPQSKATSILGITNDREEPLSTPGSNKPSTPPIGHSDHQDLLSKLLDSLPTSAPSQIVPDVPSPIGPSVISNTNTAQKRKKPQYRNKQKKPRTSDLDFDALLAIHQDKKELDTKQLHMPRTAESKLSTDVPADILAIANQVIGRDPNYENAKRNLYNQSAKQNQKPKGKSKHEPRKEPLPEMHLRPECRFYKVGKCKEGKFCRFQHIGESFRMVCRHYKTGSCNKGDECNYIHDLSIEPCRFFHLNSKCEAGYRCPYSHAPLSDDSLRRLRVLTGPCRFYHLKGFCTNGDKCPFSHDAISETELNEMKASIPVDEAPEPSIM